MVALTTIICTSKMVALATILLFEERKDMKVQDRDFSYGRCFSIIYRHAKKVNNKVLKEFHLSGFQHHYMMEICRNPGISQEDIVKHHKIDKGAMSKAIKSMVDMGYVRREQNPQDKRAYRLYPTEEAMAISGKCKRQVKEMAKRMEEGLTEEEIQTFKKLLLKVTDNIDKMMKEDKEI